MNERFLSDAMLGRLARWLRSLGYDSVYSSKGIDSQLMVKAHKENRLILTRNKSLYNKVGEEKTIFINSDDFREQLREVITALRLEYDREKLFTRCLECNLPLLLIKKEEAEELVPPYIYLTVDRFKRCSQCQRLYWSGSHIEEMEKIINTLWGKPGDKS